MEILKVILLMRGFGARDSNLAHMVLDSKHEGLYL
jgi:hypothetical protein